MYNTENSKELDQKLYNIVRACASLEDVKNEVFKNHDENRWWPLSIKDWRLRLVVAGWSSRISYRMISTYQRVVSEANKLGFDQMSVCSDEELVNIVKPLGLPRARIDYFRSVEQFLKRSGWTYETLAHSDNDSLIKSFTEGVKGAGFKVAQCAILYAKGYHCGIIPIDSGMKDMLGPCLGLQLPRAPRAHEMMRIQIETLVKENARQYHELAERLGYGSLDMPKDHAPTWWVHLVLIYFKRMHCNERAPFHCPLKFDPEFGKHIGSMCCREQPQEGRYLQ
jgi:hypothetical protein